MRSKKNHDPRSALLIAACRRDAETPGVLDNSALALLDDAARRADFMEFASRHGVIGLVAGVFVRSGVLKGRPSHADFENHLRTASRRAMIMQLERDNVLRTLEAAGIDVVLLKGSGLVSTVYGSIADRDYGDIDILLNETEINPAIAALSARGYNAPGSAAVNEGYLAHHFHVRVQRAATIVELHWAMTLPREPYSLNSAAVMREAVKHSTVPGARVPRAEHILIHMVIENVRDAFTRLTRIVDIDRIIAASPGMDWNYLEDFARRSHLLPALSLVLETSVDMLGTEIPAATLNRIRPAAAVRGHLALLNVQHALMTQHGNTRPSWKTLLQLWLVNDRSRTGAIARILRGDDEEPLEWLWLGEDAPRTIEGSVTKRIVMLSKVLSYQLYTYRKVLTS